MPKNYIKEMREVGHDDATIKDHMVTNGWHPNQVEKIFIEMGHAADGKTVQPPLSEVMIPEDSHDQNKPQQQSNTPAYRYMANPFDNLKAARLTIQANPILIGIWILSSAGAILFGILGFMAGSLVLDQFAAIAFFGLEVATPIQLLLFIVLYFTSIWIVFGTYWNGMRAIQIRALLLAMQNKPINRRTLFNGVTTSVLRLIGGSTILAAKMLIALLIPITFGGIFSPSAIIIGAFFGMIFALIIFIRNVFLPYVLTAEFSVSLLSSSHRAYHLLRKPEDKSFEVLGWIGVGAIIESIFLAASALVENGTNLVDITGVSVIAVSISVISYVILTLFHDVGFARLYLGALSLEKNADIIPRAHLINATLFVIGITLYIVANATL